MVKLAFSALVAAGLAFSPLQAHADAFGATVAGGIVGGMAGSIYAAGVAATAASVGSAIGDAAASVPNAAMTAAGVVAATSTPVLVGVAGGGAVALLLYSLVH